MPLAEFLSAVRALILDTDSYPESSEARIIEYGKRFNRLSADEIHDLATIPPEKLKIYTSTIFHGEKSTLLNHFACSFAVLEHYWQDAYSRPFSPVSLARSLHRRYPWNTNQTITLARNYQQYVEDALQAISDRYPALSELVRLELLTLETKRDAEEMSEAALSLSRDELAAMQIADILAAEVIVPSYVRGGEFTHRALDTFLRFHFNNRELYTDIKKEKNYALCGRNARLFPRWCSVPEGLYQFITTCDYDCTVEDLADAWLLGIDEERDEEEIFVEFLEQVLTLIDAGVIYVANPNTDSDLISIGGTRKSSS